MAEAFAKITGKGKVVAFSAGSKPSGQINPKAIEAMKTKRYDLSLHQSKSVEEYRELLFDYVITMGCGDACPHIPANHREEWNIPDPKNMEIRDWIKVRDLIEEKVNQLIEKIYAY